MQIPKRRKDPIPNTQHPIRNVICLSGCRKGILSQQIKNHRYEEAAQTAKQLKERFPDGFWIELQDDLTPGSHRICRELADLADHLKIGVVATNNVHYAEPEDYIAHDLLRCVATKTTREEPHPDKPLNSERYLKSAREMAELFDWRPDAIANTIRIAEQCEPALPEKQDVTPAYNLPEGFKDAAAYLRHLVYKGAKARYGGTVRRVDEGGHPAAGHPAEEFIPTGQGTPLSPQFDTLNDTLSTGQSKIQNPKSKIEARIDHELKIITELGYADYFLMAWGIARWARKQGIRVTGRGSAADSCVAYCLTLTDVDVIKRGLPFARFLTPGKVPDIDLDFPSDRRDDVFRHVVQTYGEAHTGMVCTFHTYHAKGAVRDLGKALSIPAPALEWLSNNLSGFIQADRLEQAFDNNAELRQYRHLKDRFRTLFECCARIAGFPRHIGTHSSGIVISRVPLATMAPLQDSARGITRIWQLDKDDAEKIGAIKMDILALQMLSSVSDAEKDIARKDPEFRYDRIPFGDEATFKMIRAGKSLGAFQFESPAEEALAAWMQPDHFEDLVASVALIRPGPIQGHVVQRFVACRNGWAPVDYLHPCLVPFLEKTYGCVVFQEQVLQVVAAMTGISEAAADRYRKSITQHTEAGTMDQLRQDFVAQSCAYHPDFDEQRAHKLFDQIQGWAGYGFTEGHAASFALTGYRTAYLAAHHPAEYFAGLLNPDHVGFYPHNTVVGEARRRGVRILPVDINKSQDKSHAEEPDAIRLGLRLVADLRDADIERIESERAKGEFASLVDFCARVILPRNAIENLILCGAFDLIHEHRRGLLWRLDDTIGIGHSYRAGGPMEQPMNATSVIPAKAGIQKASNQAPATKERITQSPNHPITQTAIHLGNPAALWTPIEWEIEDFSPWQKFLWTWRITAVTADCHAIAHIRPNLAKRGIITAYEAMQQKNGARVTVAGLNIRPHRPHTVSGNPVLFTVVEDETEMLEVAVLGEAIYETTSVFLTSPAVIVRGTIQRKGQGISLMLEKAEYLRMADYLTEPELPTIQPPAERTYTGTKQYATV